MERSWLLQLRHLVEVAELPSVTLQVLPDEASPM
ncbi:hypothetical protein CLV71_111113 [Actinophytocola oryzae]|uniref:DUF5753 domain-containing protein n=1 Tax=Actinophytocola oryzae TaxID=502181 RepID=A0A4R7VB11_9PSEU|nr:hypothetical protein CLV71_111113 [Actinophytocola oryzae]